jgi:hypothetical protein
MIVTPLQSAWRFSRNELSGKAGAVHLALVAVSRRLRGRTLEPEVLSQSAVCFFVTSTVARPTTVATAHTATSARAANPIVSPPAS